MLPGGALTQAAGADPDQLRLQRLRALIVDLAPPLFDQGLIYGHPHQPRDHHITPSHGQHGVPDIKMFFPPHLTVDQVNRCLCELEEYMLMCADPLPLAGLAPGTLGTDRGSALDAIVLPSGLFTAYSGCNPFDLFDEYKLLNQDQQIAVKKCLAAQDYAIIQGMPGAGKSKMLAFLIRALVARGETVLLSAYTHSAVDNLVERLKLGGVSDRCLFRLGSAASMKPTDAFVSKPPPSPPVPLPASGSSAALVPNIGLHPNVRIVACTALAVSRDVFISSVRYNTCIVEEAGQLIEPAVLSSLALAQRFVLVGDHYQLPPLVVSPQAKAQGLAVSLLRGLADRNGNGCLSVLAAQYRMNAGVMEISNSLFYGNSMRCGSTAVAERSLSTRIDTEAPEGATAGYRTVRIRRGEEASSGSGAGAGHSSEMLPRRLPSWLFECLLPKRSFVFVHIPAISSSNGSSSSGSGTNGSKDLTLRRSSSRNQQEAAVVATIIEALFEYTYMATDRKRKPITVGVISIYRKQTKEISEELSARGVSMDHVEVSTVDKFQGKEMDVVIVSTVLSEGTIINANQVPC
jgi:DNA replication ATP-dependent helicase Dna2